MDSHRFDALTRLVAMSTRRGLLRRCAGAVSGIVLAGTIVDRTAAATCRGLDAVCREHANCCSGLCGPKNRSGRRVCACPSEAEVCGDDCLPAGSFDADRDNCGACGVVCPPTTICRGGMCELEPICRSTVGDCAALDESCATLPCCSGTCSNGVCACVSSGSACADQYDCCWGFACTSGTCQPVGPEHVPCTADAECGNGAICDLLDCDLCCTNPICDGGACTPVVEPGRPCSDDDCGAEGRCTYQGCRTCSSGGATYGDYTAGIPGDECPWPMAGFACTDDPETGAPGYAYCCIPGENCQGDPCTRSWSPDRCVQGQAIICFGI